MKRLNKLLTTLNIEVIEIKSCFENLLPCPLSVFCVRHLLNRKLGSPPHSRHCERLGTSLLPGLPDLINVGKDSLFDPQVNIVKSSYSCSKVVNL